MSGSISALVPEDDHFVALHSTSGPIDGTRPPEHPPSALPGNLSEVDQRHGPPVEAQESPITVFVTVDVEDSYFDRPILMSGDGIGREFGVFGILDQLDLRGLKGTFFVNVYEKDRQPDGVVEAVVREIAARGHEVGLHTHPSSTLAFYRRPLFRLRRDAQVAVLRWGSEQIASWTGHAPTSFRAGGYALNEDTFAALEEVGFAVDSSCFFPSPNNHHTNNTVNAIADVGSMIEVPVTTVLRADEAGGLAHRKLDVNWLSREELVAALASLARHGADFATFMMHSFSFIEKETRMPDQPPSSQARFVSPPHMDRYVEVYGSNPALRASFGLFLDGLASEPLLTVSTLKDALPALRSARCPPDIVPVVP